MARYTPRHGGGRYSYADSYYDDRYYDSRYYDDRYYGGYDDYYGGGRYGGYYGGPGGMSFYDDMAVGYGRGRGYNSARPGTIIIEREPEFVCDDEKLVGGSRPRLPQRLLRCASAGSLVERPDPTVQWQRQVQVDRCQPLPWKRDANQCDAVAPPKPFQRKVGWQQFEESMVKSFENALKRQQEPASRDDKVVVMQGQVPSGQQTYVQQQRPKTQKYTVTVLNPGGAQAGYAPGGVQAGYAPTPTLATAGYAARPVPAGGYVQPVIQQQPQIVSGLPAAVLGSQRQVVQPVHTSINLGPQVGGSQPHLISQPHLATSQPTLRSQPLVASQQRLVSQPLVASQQRLVSQPAGSQIILGPTGTVNRTSASTSRIVTRS